MNTMVNEYRICVRPFSLIEWEAEKHHLPHTCIASSKLMQIPSSGRGIFREFSLRGVKGGHGLLTGTRYKFNVSHTDNVNIGCVIPLSDVTFTKTAFVIMSKRSCRGFRFTQHKTASIPPNQWSLDFPDICVQFKTHINKSDPAINIIVG